MSEELYEKAKAWEEARKQTFVGQVEELKKAVRELFDVLATFPPLKWMIWLCDKLLGVKREK